MDTRMQSQVVQAAAVGVIALIAAFPNQERLFDAIGLFAMPEVKVEVDSDLLKVRSRVHENLVSTVKMPPNFSCAYVTHSSSKEALASCTISLSSYLQSENMSAGVRSSRVGAIQGLSPHKDMEQARRALAEVCRVQWSLGTLEEMNTMDACAPVL